MDYKHKFENIIAPELEIGERWRKYFDEWGGRAYVFSEEVTYQLVRYLGVDVADINIDMDELPDYYKVRSHYTSTDQLLDYLMENTDIRIVYPKQDLMKVKEENPDILLYHKLDTHWNYAGGYIGARSLAEELGIKMPSLDEIFIQPKLSSEGDLTNMLNIKIKNGDIDYNVYGISLFDKKEWDSNPEFIYYTIGGDARKIFVRRDSFSTALVPALAEQFESSVWVHRGNYDQQQIFDHGADIFVLETVERYVMSLQNFRVSFVSSSVENCENGTKRITIKPAISEVDLQHISIFKKDNETEDFEAIQILEPFNESIVLEVLGDEAGQICIYIYADEAGEEMLEEATIKY